MTNDTIKTRTGLEARYKLFDQFALSDQKLYYEHAIKKNRKVGTKINRYRALFSFLAGLAAAAAGLLVQMFLVDSATCGVDTVNQPGYCHFVDASAIALAICAVIFPAIGTFFSTLADLYQWDRLTGIYDSALRNLEVADAMSPPDAIPKEELEVYQLTFHAYVKEAINVMKAETAQWGQSVRTPKQVEDFVARQQEKSQRLFENDAEE